MNREKFILKSKTIQGVILMLLPMLATVFGLDLPEGITAQVEQVLTGAITTLGAAWAVYGRFTATDKISVLPE